MEHYDKEIGDITYMSELTPHPVTSKKYFPVSGCGVKFAPSKGEVQKKIDT